MFFSKKTKRYAPIVEGQLSHIGFIMDGNGRWATSRGLSRSVGHKMGANSFEKVVKRCYDLGINCVSVYALSTENLSRPKDEIDYLFSLLESYVERFFEKLDENRGHIVFIGDLSVLPAKLRQRVFELDQKTRHHKYRLNIAVCYGGRAEIVRAANLSFAKNGGTPITQADIEAHLYTCDCPPLDLVVRSAGEMRLSNFLIWQASYAEYYFTKTLWPDMNNADVDAAVLDFLSRKRKYGKVV